MGLLDNLLATGANIAGIEKARDDLLTAGTQAQTGAQTIGTQAQTATQFQPFAVTGAAGGATTTPQGGLTLALTPEQQALQTSLFGTASGLAGQLGQFDQAGREQDVYSRLRAMQAPEEERQRLALEQRLLGQGRLGVKTAQYGGTPEQFAMAKAQTEAQNHEVESRLSGRTLRVSKRLEELTGLESRVTILGHLQRGGGPTTFDRVLSSKYGAHAVRLIVEKKFGQMVCYDPPHIQDVAIADAVGKLRTVDPHGSAVVAARAMGICFGDTPGYVNPFERP